MKQDGDGLARCARLLSTDSGAAEDALQGTQLATPVVMASATIGPSTGQLPATVNRTSLPMAAGAGRR